MRLSLRYRLLLPLALLLIGDAAATAWAAVVAARSVEQELAKRLWGIARTLTEPRPTGRPYPLAEWVLEQMKGFSGGAEFLLVRPGGTLESATFPKPWPQPPESVPLAPQPEVDEEHTLGPPVQVGGAQYRCLRVRLDSPERDAGSDLYIFYPEALRRRAVWDAVQPLLVLGGLGGLIAVALAVAFGSRLVARVRDLDARTRLIAGGDFRPMPVPRGNDELRDLCESVNDMARRLAAFQEALQRDERLRVLGQFSGGLAHQLRNAATGAKLALELYLQENPDADPEPLTVALRQLARIEANLRQFLALGKPPAGIRKPTDLVKLIDAAVSLLHPQAQHAGTTIEWNPPTEACVISGEVGELSHLLGNVIGNAMEAAGTAGRVVVQVHVTGDHIAIEVADTGPGPPPEIAARLFEPFVTGKEQGIGLGLAVAKQAAESHGGTLTWARRDGLTVFRIELPRSEPCQ